MLIRVVHHDHSKPARAIRSEPQVGGLIEAIADGFRAPGLQAKLDRLENRKTTLERELAEAAAPAPRLHTNLAELYAVQVARLHEALADPATRDEALEITRALIERVLVKPGEARRTFEIELEGEIAAMVELAQDANIKKAVQEVAAVPDAFWRSVKVVAGARNCLYLLLFAGGLVKAFPRLGN
jgi:hypothetical protein